MCRRKQLAVIKVIRVIDLKSYKDLFAIPNLDLKVHYLSINKKLILALFLLLIMK